MNKLQRWILGRETVEQLKRLPPITRYSPGPMAPSAGTSYSIINGNIISSEDNKHNYIVKGYQANDIIYSIVNLICEKVRVAPWAAYKVEDESSLKLYQAIMNRKDMTGDDYVRAMNFRKKALVPYTGDGKLNELLKYPNDYCTFSNLVADSGVFKLVCGGRMIWAEQLGAGANGSLPQSLHHLPYDLMTIVASREFPIKVVGYKLENWGIGNLSNESVMHDKYFNPKFDSMGGHLFGQSPMKAGLSLMDMSNSATKAATSQFQNQGPPLVIFMDDPRFSPDQGDIQAQAIKKIIQGKEYAGPENRGKVATSGYKMGSVPVGLSSVDLGIVQLQDSQLRRFCNLFGAVPSQVLNDPENKTYNNSQEGERALTARGALPIIVSFRDAFNMKLGSDWGYKGKNIYVDADTTCYSELQDNLKEKWGWVRELPVTWQYKLDLMGLDYEEGASGLDEVMIPTGFQPIDALTVVDEILGNGNGQAASQNGNGAVSANGRGKAGVPV